MKIPPLGEKPPTITDRSLSHVPADAAAARAIAQAAINVELFTIPLYMGTMYSIHGMHQINAEGQTFYMGREWPGMSTRAKPGTPNEKAFNIIFSVFIQEMLHLQMAANIATAIGVQPSFTSLALQTEKHGWHCYGPRSSVIPHIVDLKDTKSLRDVRVNVEGLNENQCKLFIAIEQPESKAREELMHLAPVSEQKYFPEVPFTNWTASSTELDLPMFGTIGWMYECYAQYLSIKYTDGETLFDKMYKPGSVQQDLFNVETRNNHPKREFPRFDTLLTAADQVSAATAFDKVIDMMSAITDQGEGDKIDLQQYRKHPLLTAVKCQYQEDRGALEEDYKSYDQHGHKAPSRDAAARADSKAKDHWARFQEVQQMLKDIVTWEQWHAVWDKEGKGWTKADLTNQDYDPEKAPKNIPRPEAVADALNRLKKKGEPMHELMSKVAVGAIAGITTVLDTYWKNQKTTFPYPSMVGSGDRVSICWAIFGKAPDLGLGLDAPDEKTLYHACQGLSLAKPDVSAQCAAIEIYHSCRGSNSCRAQGGCGFAQADAGGGSCGNSGCGSAAASSKALCGGPTPPEGGPYSAPSDNKCATFGGCAVPISASQLFPRSTISPLTMKLYDFRGPGHEPVQLKEAMTFAVNDSVYEKAWDAYKAVMASRGQPVTEPMPEPNDLRVALPPST